MINFEPVKMEDSACRSVSTLNTWTEEKKAEARKLLEEGYWVHFSSSCIGHTLAQMVEGQGFQWVREEYGDDAVQEAIRDNGWGTWYIRLAGDQA